MMKRGALCGIFGVAVIGAVSFILFSGLAYAHCDTLDGPVVTTAKKAIENGDVTPILKWVKNENETEIRELFKKTMTVRAKGPEAKELADLYFLETLVRIHRAGEGEPYTGLKPTGNLDFAIVESDKALETGKADELVKMVANEVEEGIRKRFQKALEKKKHADDSAEAGREFVEAYVGFLHYMERLHQVMKAPADGHGGHAGHKEVKDSGRGSGHAADAQHKHK